MKLWLLERMMTMMEEAAAVEWRGWAEPRISETSFFPFISKYNVEKHSNDTHIQQTNNGTSQSTDSDVELVYIRSLRR